MVGKRPEPIIIKPSKELKEAIQEIERALTKLKEWTRQQDKNKGKK